MCFAEIIAVKQNKYNELDYFVNNAEKLKNETQPHSESKTKF